MPPTAAARPNILLITTDQQRFDTFGSYRPSFMRTPHLDQLADEGIVFASAYSDCPVCVPARITIMSGKSALTHRRFGAIRCQFTEVAVGARLPKAGRFGASLPKLLLGRDFQKYSGRFGASLPKLLLGRDFQKYSVGSVLGKRH